MIRDIGPRQQHFKELCKEQKLPHKKFQLDVTTLSLFPTLFWA